MRFVISMTMRKSRRSIEIRELQWSFSGLSCHTPAAVFFVFLRDPKFRLVFAPKAVRLYAGPFQKSSPFYFGTPIEYPLRDSESYDEKENEY